MQSLPLWQARTVHTLINRAALLYSIICLHQLGSCLGFLNTGTYSKYICKLLRRLRNSNSCSCPSRGGSRALWAILLKQWLDVSVYPDLTLALTSSKDKSNPCIHPGLHLLLYAIYHQLLSISFLHLSQMHPLLSFTQVTPIVQSTTHCLSFDPCIVSHLDFRILSSSAWQPSGLLKV